MSWAAVGTHIARARAPGIKVEFNDGHEVRVFPTLKVASVTAPSGQTCSLKSQEGRGHLAALCDSREAVQKFQEHLGQHPAQAAGADPVEPIQAKEGLQIRKIHLVDRYV